MPVHDVGYRSWDGKLTSLSMRWYTITLTAIRLAWKSTWVKRSVFAAWLPVMYWGATFLLLESFVMSDAFQGTTSGIEQSQADAILNELGEGLDLDPSVIQAQAQAKLLKSRLKGFMGNIPISNKVSDAIETGDENIIRREVWRFLLMTFFRYPQGLMIVFLVGAIAPALISRDIRSRAFLLYFSKPIGRWEYIFGKLMAPAFFIACVTTLPAIALYIVAVFLSPDFSVVISTWDIPFRILIGTLVLVIPTCTLALMLSSLTQESRYANFSWFAVWILGQGAYFSVLLATGIQMQKNPFGTEVLESSSIRNWSALSLYNCLGEAQSVVFGMETLDHAWRGIVVLIVITFVSLLILIRRVSASTQS